MIDPSITPAAFAIFIITISISILSFKNPGRYARLMLHPYSFFRLKGLYTPLSSGFIHADAGHLVLNMLTFYFFAFGLESLIGSWNFLVIYLSTLILSDISTLIKQRNNPDYRCLGASGAISGVLFSYILILPTTKIYLLFLPIGIPAPLFAALYVIYGIHAARKGRDNINHEAHLWGALSGFLITLALFPGLWQSFLQKISNIF